MNEGKVRLDLFSASRYSYFIFILPSPDAPFEKRSRQLRSQVMSPPSHFHYHSPSAYEAGDIENSPTIPIPQNAAVGVMGVGLQNNCLLLFANSAKPRFEVHIPLQSRRFPQVQITASGGDTSDFMDCCAFLSFPETASDVALSQQLIPNIETTKNLDIISKELSDHSLLAGTRLGAFRSPLPKGDADRLSVTHDGICVSISSQTIWRASTLPRITVSQRAFNSGNWHTSIYRNGFDDGGRLIFPSSRGTCRHTTVAYFVTSFPLPGSPKWQQSGPNPRAMKSRKLHPNFNVYLFVSTPFRFSSRLSSHPRLGSQRLHSLSVQDNR